MLKREHLEQELMNRYGKSFDEAHALTEKKYNYRKEIEKERKGE